MTPSWRDVPRYAGAAPTPHHHHARGHPYRMDRRRFLAATAGAAGLLAAGPALARAGTNRNPRPINGGIDPFHVYPVSYKSDNPPEVWLQNTVRDFNGVFGSTDVTGFGKDNTGRELYFRCDMRMSRGEYVAVDGKRYQGAFGFI